MDLCGTSAGPWNFTWKVSPHWLVPLLLQFRLMHHLSHPSRLWQFVKRHANQSQVFAFSQVAPNRKE
jgi:hypothetical protein